MFNGDINAIVAMGKARQVEQQSLSSGATTDNVPEGSTNLYFTASRARNVFQVNPPLDYDSGLGALVLPKADASTDGYLSNADWDIFNSKSDFDGQYSSLTGVPTGFTGSLQVVTSVDFANSLTTTATINIVDGIITEIL